MSGAPGVTFVVSYKCPYCGAALEGRTTRADAWLRCPGCGRASQPPEHAVTSEAPPAAAAPPEDVLVIGPEPAPAPAPAAAALRGVAATAATTAPAPADPRRVAVAAALFVAVVLLVFSFLEQSLIGTGVFSVLAAVSLVLLARPDRSRGTT